MCQLGAPPRAHPRRYFGIMSVKRSAYSRLLEHVQEVRPTANDQPVDDDDNDAGPSNSRALDDDGQAELQEPEEEDADEDDDDDDKKDAQWLSPGYDAHYGGEWPASALDAKKASWREAKWQLGGLGAAGVGLLAFIGQEGRHGCHVLAECLGLI